MFRQIPTAVDTGAARPILVRLAFGWDTHIIGQGKSDQRVWISPWHITQKVFVIFRKISDHTEQHGSKQCFRGKTFQVGVGVPDNGTFGSEETGENIAL